MRIDTTIITTQGERHEVVVEASDDHRGADLDDALRTAVGIDDSHSLWVGGDTLCDLGAVGRAPLLDGMVVQSRPTGVPPRPAQRRLAPLRLVSISGPDSGRSLDLTPGRHTIGRSPGCDLAVDDIALSRVHLELTVSTEGVHCRDLGTTNGSTLDGAALPTDRPVPLTAGSVLRVGAHTFALRTSTARPARTSARGGGEVAVSTTPAVRRETRSPTITFPAQPADHRQRRIPWVMVLAPLPVALAMAYFFGPRMLVFALLSPVMILGNVISDRVGSRADSRREQDAWRTITAERQSRLSAALTDERLARHRTCPDAHEVLVAAEMPSTRLWERRLDQGDALAVRLGTGTLPARVTVDVERTSRREHPLLEDVPVVLDLDEVTVLGIYGDQVRRESVARWVLGQLSVLTSPSELEVCLLGEDGWWGALRLAPHARLGPRSGGSVQDLAADVARRQAAADHGDLPRVIVVVDRPTRLRTDPAWRAVLRDGPSVGYRVLVTAGTAEELPHEARALVRCTSTAGRLEAPDLSVAVDLEGVSASWSERVGRSLAALRDATPGRREGTVPTEAALLHLVDAGHTSADELVQRWRDSPSFAVPLGVGADGPLVVDLVADGPHALVGGTTGSGKSELLQSWIAALVLHLGPDDLSLILVDYKGGAAFAGCAELPHTVGVLTDLDATGARRALTSLDAELRRREHLLAEVGAPDLDSYHRDGGHLPRLLIVIDEFRMLAEDQPDVLRDLVRLAALGRSLGIHLVLATQRPGGVITPEIRANVNLRISLRVRDRVDSEDVVGCADAALIAEGMPGRAVLRTGADPARHFQTAYVGGHCSQERPLRVCSTVGQLLWESRAAGRVSTPSSPAVPDLQRVVALAQEAHRRSGAAEPHRPWLPPLPTDLGDQSLAHLDDKDPAGLSGSDRAIPWGLVDRPAQQRQDVLRWHLDDGHWLVVGGAGSGRSTAVQSLLSRAERHLHGRVITHLVGAPGGVADDLVNGSLVDPGDRSVLRRFVSRLREDVDRRREALRATGHDSFGMWWDAWQSGAASPPPPVAVVAIDGWHQVARIDQRGDLDVVSDLEDLIRDGAALGLRFVITGGRELLGGRLPALVRRRLVLHLPDRADVAAAGIARDTLGAACVPGRGVLPDTGELVQVALPAAQVARTRVLAEAWWWRVAQIPHAVDLADLAPSAAAPSSGHRVAIGSGGGSEPVLVDLERTGGGWLVVGPRGSGRTTVLRTVVDQLLTAGVPVATVGGDLGDPRLVASLTRDDGEGLVRRARQHDGLVVVVDDAELIADAPIEEALRQYAAFCAAGGGAVLASSTTAASTRPRGIVGHLARNRHGLLLQPSARSDGDVFGLRVPALTRVPGRGYVLGSEGAQEVQVATLDLALGRRPR